MTTDQPDSPNPIYARWWFIALVVLIALLGIGILLSDMDPEQEPVAADKTTTTTSTSQTTTTVPPTTSAAPTTSTTSGPTTTSSLADLTTTSTSRTTTTTFPGPSEVLVLDVLATIPVELETQDGYDRDLFAVWSDLDGDGCDARAEVLVRDAVESPSVGSGCDVGSGVWYSVYDGVWLDDARQLQVDHVVALKEAWDSGARDWDASRRVAFGNDLTSPLSLIAVSSSSNQDKGDADASNWLPSNGADVCRYVAAVVVIKFTWDLSMDESEHGRIRNLLQGQCAGTTVDDAEVTYPTAPPTTTTTIPTSKTTVAGTTDVIIADIRFDGPGNDVEFGDSEYVILRNNGTGTADVAAWSLEDEASHVITIPSGYVMQPDGELRIYSGPGNSTPAAYYEGLGQAIWNNSGGDTATLTDATGRVVDTYSYSS